MPMAVNFRWKAPTVQAAQPNSVKDGWAQSFTQAAQAISDAKDYRWKKAETERRNRIEDEDRSRRTEWEDRQRSAWGEAANMMRGLAGERAKLVKRAEEIRSRLAQLGV